MLTQKASTKKKSETGSGQDRHGETEFNESKAGVLMRCVGP
jgi:hypothetical protein